MWKALLLAWIALPAPAQTPPEDRVLRGAAVEAGRLYTWGTHLTEAARRIATSVKGFGEGGCVDRNGRVLLQDGEPAGALVLFSETGRRIEWDRRVEMHECVFTGLLGRYGALITDHYGQVRFYEGPGKYTEIYSFYTPSRQAGLLVSDVDGDGFADIFCGNYWIRSPKRFDLPWRLFAINTRHKTPDAATLRLALRGRDLFAAQGHMNPGALLRYRPPAAATALWEETVVAADLRYPHALATTPFGVFVAENDGPGSGIFRIQETGALERVATTGGIHSMFLLDGNLVAIGRNEIVHLNAADMRRRR